MTDVFISYKSEDRPMVAELVSALEADGLRAWWDQHIPADAAWEINIERALADAKAVVVCWSSASVNSDNVKAEARKARQEGRLLQVFLDDCDPPLFFGERQGVNLARWNGDRTDRKYRLLLDGVTAVVAGKRASQEVGYVPKRGSKLPLLLGGVALAILAASAILTFGNRTTLETGQASAPAVTLEGLFSAEALSGTQIVGADLRHLESITGPPSTSYAFDNHAIAYIYQVEGCEVSAIVPGTSTAFQGASPTTIVALGLTLDPRIPSCTFDIGNFFGLEQTLPATSTIGQIQAALPLATSYFTTDCPDLLSCGNAYDPFTYFSGTTARVYGFRSIQVSFFPNDNRPWLEAIAVEKGEVFLREQFACDPMANDAFDAALQTFEDDRPYSILIGYLLPYPAPLRGTERCATTAPESLQ